MLELHLAADRTTSPERAALYLAHAADERRHARAFIAHATKLGNEDAAQVFHADEHALFETLGEAGFLAFVHHGERRGIRQLGAHRAYFAAHGDAAMRALFDRILEDEHRHAAYTLEELEKLLGSRGKTRRALALAAFRDAKLGYLRLARSIAGRLFRGSMAIVYLVALPLVVLFRGTGGRTERR